MNKAEKHADHMLYLWRYLGLNVTAKIHCVEDHVIPLLRRLRGIGDFGEDVGERAHQIRVRFEARSKGLRNIQPRANAHTIWETMSKNQDVKKHQELVQVRSKRKYKTAEIVNLRCKLKPRRR